MKQYLILSALGVCAIAHAGAPAAPVRMPSADAHAMSTASSTPVAQNGKQGEGPRHLSEAERAELRRQLEQFNRQYSKRP